MRVAVTGATGFVGKRVVASLRAQGVDFHAYGSRAVADVPESLRSHYTQWDIAAGPLPSPHDVDAVVHAAALVDTWGPAAAFENINVTGTRNVIKTWPDAHIVHLSSSSVYPAKPGKLLREADAEPADLDAISGTRYLNHYSRTKALAEHEVVTSARDYTILRPHRVYQSDQSRLVAGLQASAIHGRILAVGDGHTTRSSITHIDNLVGAINQSLATRAHGVFNIADPVTPTVHEVLTSALHQQGAIERPIYVPRALAAAGARVLETVWSARHATTPPPLTRYAVEHQALGQQLDISAAVAHLGYAPQRAWPESFVAGTP